MTEDPFRGLRAGPASFPDHLPPKPESNHPSYARGGGAPIHFHRNVPRITQENLKDPLASPRDLHKYLVESFVDWGVVQLVGHLTVNAREVVLQARERERSAALDSEERLYSWAFSGLLPAQPRAGERKTWQNQPTPGLTPAKQGTPPTDQKERSESHSASSQVLQGLARTGPSPQASGGHVRRHCTYQGARDARTEGFAPGLVPEAVAQLVRRWNMRGVWLGIT